MRWECLKLRSNILHAKFAVSSRTIDLQKLRLSNCGEIEKVEIAPERVSTVLEISYGGWSVTETVRGQGCD